MQLTDLAQQFRYSKPGYDLICDYEAGIPIYKARLNATVLKKQELPTIEQFVLRLIHLGVNDQAKLIDLLGLEPEFVRNALLRLDQEQLIKKLYDVANQHVSFGLSRKGEIALRNELDTESVVTLYFRVDGYTGEIANDDEMSLEYGDALRKRNAIRLSPIAETRPTVESLNLRVRELQDIYRETLEGLEPSSLNDQLLDITEVEKLSVYYKAVYVLMFRDRANQQLDFQVFQGHAQNDQYARLISRSERNGKRVVPEERLVSMFDIDSNGLLNTIAPELQRVELAAKRAAELESDKSIIEQDKQRIVTEISLDRTDSTATNEVVTTRSARLAERERQLNERDSRLASLEQELKKVRHYGNRLIQDIEHRDLLKNALRDARQRLLIISPWINRGATDKEIIGLLSGALKRGVCIAIGFGLTERPGQSRATFLDPSVESQFQNMQRQYGDRLYYDFIDSHEKILVCDAEYCVVTSFNWLSYRGDKGFRRETGTYSKDPVFIDEVTRAVMQSFHNLPELFVLEE